MFVFRPPQTVPLVAGLSVLMAVTRFHHEGSTFALPDASFAVFFLGGLLAAGRRYLGWLIALAAIVDFAAIRFGGESGFCLTPAYAFLLPAYGVLWEAGRLARPCLKGDARSWLNGAAILGLAVGGAFAISEIGFFLFSGKFALNGAAGYFASALQYLPAYLVPGFAYCASILGVRALFRSRMPAVATSA